MTAPARRHRRAIAGLVVLVACSASMAAGGERTDAGTAQGERTWFPSRTLFAPPLAGSLEPRFGARLLVADLGPVNRTLGVASFGDTFGVVRWRDARGLDWQLGLVAGVDALFDLETGSRELWNTDFLVGIPLTLRRGRLAARARLYHRSSHLGDEFLLGDPPVSVGRRRELSYEVLELTAAWRQGPTRIYAGASRLVGRAIPVGRHLAQGGVEYDPDPDGQRRARPFAALDLAAWSETGWEPEVTLRAGFAMPRPWRGRGRLLVSLELRDGPLPFGQFYGIDSRWVGIGLSLSD